MTIYIYITMEESERTVKCALSEDVEIKDFSDELKNFPYIMEYIKKLHEQIQLQQNNIIELKDKLTCIEKHGKHFEKHFVDNETQTNWLESNEQPLLHEWISDKNEKVTNIIDQATDAAELAMLQTGFVYEKTTGLYYHYDSGYYYDAKSGLYYNGNTGTYYYYDKESKSYRFHSQIHKVSNELIQTLPCTKENIKGSRIENKDRKKVRLIQGVEQDKIIELEEGECSDNEEKESTSSKEDILKSSSSIDSEVEKDEDIAKVYPPCMRIIVKETNLSNLRVGSLFIVTCIGGSIGREGDHSVMIPDINISKHHAKIQYNEIKSLYEITDLGSRNGTLLNGKRLSAAKQESEPTEIVHGSTLQLNFTKLLCHIHNGYETCGHCEPGLLQFDSVIEDNFISTRNQYQSELKRLKFKFGLEQSNIEAASRLALGYQDRAQSRREHIGSSSQHAKTQQSSLDESISKDNMGFKILSKMGWTAGESLGKSCDGAIEPVPLPRSGNKAGLGASDEHMHDFHIDPSTEKKQAIWKKTQQRFKDIIE